MTISSLGRIPSRPLGLDPLQGLRVEYPQVGVILLTVITPEHIQLLLVESRCMILNLRSSVRIARLYGLRLTPIEARGVRGDYPLELGLLLCLDADVGLRGVAAAIVVTLIEASLVLSGRRLGSFVGCLFH